MAANNVITVNCDMTSFEEAHHVLEEMAKLSVEIGKNIERICEGDMSREKGAWRTDQPKDDEWVLAYIESITKNELIMAANGLVGSIAPVIAKYDPYRMCWITRETGQVYGCDGMPYVVTGWYPLPDLTFKGNNDVE